MWASQVSSLRTLPHGTSLPPQDSIYDEMEDKWSKRKAEWEKDEKIEREKILLQQSEYRSFWLFVDACIDTAAIQLGPDLQKAALDFPWAVLDSQIEGSLNFQECKVARVRSFFEVLLSETH